MLYLNNKEKITHSKVKENNMKIIVVSVLLATVGISPVYANANEKVTSTESASVIVPVSISSGSAGITN